ncbi:MAG: phenazine biosynthesis protein PhzF family [Gammaproteobacteria bacterium]|jgi:PhzF family phenazine biosynthesis protein|nr:phenazine biosynthesis protein PhzF family [Gammaproteobacteria bacterium]
MPTITLYHVDAFTTALFSGNPAAVCPLEAWLTDDTLLKMAQENNLSETAFMVATPEGYHLRWFSPHGEMTLCGHATLASAFVVFQFLRPHLTEIQFQSLSGILTVTRQNELLTLDFPKVEYTACPMPDYIIAGLNVKPLEFYRSPRYLAVLENEAQIRNLSLNVGAFAAMDLAGIVVTARSDNDKYDFVSRYFTPKIPRIEDAVTGATHCALAPYWGLRLNKTKLLAKQLSARGGEMVCELRDDRVFLSGHAVLYMKGEVLLNK